MVGTTRQAVEHLGHRVDEVVGGVVESLAHRRETTQSAAHSRRLRRWWDGARNVAGARAGDVGARRGTLRHDGDPADGRADGARLPDGHARGVRPDRRAARHDGRPLRRGADVPTPRPDHRREWSRAEHAAARVGDPHGLLRASPPAQACTDRRTFTRRQVLVGRGRSVGIDVEARVGGHQPPLRRRRRRRARRTTSWPTTSTNCTTTPATRWCCTSGLHISDLGPLALLLDHTAGMGDRRRRRDARALRRLAGHQRAAGRAASVGPRDRRRRHSPDLARRGTRNRRHRGRPARRLPARVRHAAHDRLRRHAPHPRRDARADRGDARRSAAAR